jgi:hypothetical protein
LALAAQAFMIFITLEQEEQIPFLEYLQQSVVVVVDVIKRVLPQPVAAPVVEVEFPLALELQDKAMLGV